MINHKVAVVVAVAGLSKLTNAATAPRGLPHKGYQSKKNIFHKLVNESSLLNNFKTKQRSDIIYLPF
jgi:hypothetical protein